MQRALAALLLLALAITSAAATPNATAAHGGGWTRTYYSRLWGRWGEKWDPAGRLADWSMAGYGGDGRSEIPRYRYALSVVQFGAKPVPGFDNALAFQAAIDAAAKLAGPGRHGGKAVHIPPGNWTLNQTVFINSSFVVLRGSGMGRTTLYFPNGLEAVYGTKTWQYSGAFLGVQGTNPLSRWQENEKITLLWATANRGDRYIKVVDSTPFQLWTSWYHISVPQDAPNYGNPSRRRSLLAAVAPALGQRLAGLFSGNPALCVAALQAAANEWGLLPAGTAATVCPTPAARAASGAQPSPPLNSFLMAAAKYAVANAVSDWAASSVSGVRPADAAPGSVDWYLYGDGLVPSGDHDAMFKSSDRIRFPFRVVAKGPGWLKLDRPVPVDLKLEWAPRVYPWKPTVQHSGMEGFSVQFKWDTYAKKDQSKGYNALALYDVANCWMRQIEVVDADIGVWVNGAQFSTVEGVRFRITAPRGIPGGETEGLDGRQGLEQSHGSYTVVRDFKIPFRFLRDITATVFGHNCVFSDGQGADLCMNHNRAAPHNNLFTSLDFGLGTRVWEANGSKNRGAHAAANNTYWNLRASKLPGGLSQPTNRGLDCEYGPLLNLVGYWNATLVPSTCNVTKWTNENIGAWRTLEPRNLYWAQRSRVEHWGWDHWWHD